MALEAIEVGGVVGIAYLLGESLKLAITKLGERKDANGYVKLSKDLYEVIKATGEGTKALLELHDARDEDGRLRWYFPTSVTKSQERTARALERIGRVLDNLELRISHCPYQGSVAPPPSSAGPVRRPSGVDLDPVGS